MADSITTTGGLPFFPLETDWVDDPVSTPVLARRLMEYRGTVRTIETITGDTPLLIETGVAVLTHSDCYILTRFFAEQKGRLGRFWLKHPKHSFTLKQDAVQGDTDLVCCYNRAAAQLRGVERIYILMSNGDIVIRQITGASSSAIDGTVTLTLDTPLDRVVNEGNHFCIGRVYLVRFDQDELPLSFFVPSVTETIRLRFYELSGEYEEL